jgi:hypothetical protein
LALQALEHAGTLGARTDELKELANWLFCRES